MASLITTRPVGMEVGIAEAMRSGSDTGETRGLRWAENERGRALYFRIVGQS